MTIFSASRYCGRGTNKGAFIMFDPDLTHTVQQFVAGSLGSTAPTPPGAGKLEPGPEPFDKVRLILRCMCLRTVCPFLHALCVSVRVCMCVAQEHEALVAMIIERLCLHKADLYWFFCNADDEHSGRCTKVEWGEAMRLVLELDLPWLSLCDELVDYEPVRGCCSLCGAAVVVVHGVVSCGVSSVRTAPSTTQSFWTGTRLS